ncbi:unnamed protein product, partial [Durusdinium trenchii]
RRPARGLRGSPPSGGPGRSEPGGRPMRIQARQLNGTVDEIDVLPDATARELKQLLKDSAYSCSDSSDEITRALTIVEVVFEMHQLDDEETLLEAGITAGTEVPDETLVERGCGRRLDPETGEIYHLKFRPPPEEVVERLVHRSDDQDRRCSAAVWLRWFRRRSGPKILG